MAPCPRGSTCLSSASRATRYGAVARLNPRWAAQPPPNPTGTFKAVELVEQFNGYRRLSMKYVEWMGLHTATAFVGHHAPPQSRLLLRKNLMAKKFVDGYGDAWRDVVFPGGESRRVREQVDQDEVQLEQREIFKARALLHKAFWFIAAGAGVLTAVTIGTLVYIVYSHIPALNFIAFAVVICCALLAGLLVAYCIQIHDRVYRMELHLLTLHNAILSVKERLDRP